MIIVNYVLCVLALAALCWETWQVAKRNRTIAVKGKDDFFSLCLILLFAMLILRLDLSADFVESLRNTLILMAIFFSMAVKRGVSARGIEKFGYYLPWERITGLQIEAYQMSKLILHVSTDKRQVKLFFPKYQLKKLVYELQKYHSKVMIDETLKLN